MSESQGLLNTIPLVDFFRERVQKALANLQISASEILEFYIVNLLQDFRKTEKLFEQKDSKMWDKPLALWLAQAMEGDLHTRIRCLKQLGDVSLYTAGVFGESIRKKIIDRDYYIRMGCTAYQSLSQMLTYQKTFAELYAELSLNFPNLVNVLSEVASTTPLNTNQDILRLYERWLATGDERMENMLKEAGIMLAKDLAHKPQ
ncbi:MAG: hypothetical protein Q7T03_07275 [Deltaproteobacteria bacterium]|nr:hypothetical protein [Deltaproteobacteria bacterium]